MSRLATMGTFSCATLAISGFKSQDKNLNEAYRADPKKELKGDGMTVEEFYNKIIVPTSQPLGKTAEYPFEFLMDKLENHDLGTKYISTTLNNSQMNEGYWPEILKKHGFEVVDETNNTLGERCTIWVRNRNRPKK